MKKTGSKDYIPALAFPWLTRFYDAFFRLFMPEQAIRQKMLERVRLNGSLRLLDVGCGTGTLAQMIAKNNPMVQVSGIDIDPAMLDQAKEKSKMAGIVVDYRLSDGGSLPFGDRTFDAVVSSLAFHHMPPLTKRFMLTEIHRVLKPGGRLLLMDWGKPSGVMTSILFFIAQCFDGFETTSENRSGKIPELIREAGLSNVIQTYVRDTMFGTLVLHEGLRQ